MGKRRKNKEVEIKIWATWSCQFKREYHDREPLYHIDLNWLGYGLKGTFFNLTL